MCDSVDWEERKEIMMGIPDVRYDDAPPNKPERPKIRIIKESSPAGLLGISFIIVAIVIALVLFGGRC